MGLNGLVALQLTSTTTDNLRDWPAATIWSFVTQPNRSPSRRDKCQCERASSHTRAAGMKADRSDATAGCVGEELEIAHPIAGVESVECRCQPGRFLVTACELGVCGKGSSKAGNSLSLMIGV